MKKKILSSFVLSILSSGLFFLFNFYLAKLLGAHIYGEIVYYLSFINILALLFSLNYQSLYMGSKIVNGDNQTFSLFFSIETLSFLILAIPTFFIIQHYIKAIDLSLYIIIIAYLIVIVSMVGIEYNTQKRVSASIFISILLPRIILISTFLTLYLLYDKSAKVYLYSYIFANIVIYLYILYTFKPKFYIKKDIFKRAWKFYLLGIIGSSFGYIAQILQKEYGSYSQLATLSIVILFFAGLSLVDSILVKFILPKMHDYYKEGNYTAIGELYANNTFLVLLSALPIVLLLIINLQNISDILGDGYALLPHYFLILLIGYSIDFITGLTGNILRTTEHEHYEVYNEIARFVIGIGSIYLLKDNIYGIPIAITVSMLVYNILKYAEVYYLFKFIPLKQKQFLYIILLSLALYVVLYGISCMSILLYTKILLEGSILLAIYYAIYIHVKHNKNLFKGYQ